MKKLITVLLVIVIVAAVAWLILRDTSDSVISDDSAVDDEMSSDETPDAKTDLSIPTMELKAQTVENTEASKEIGIEVKIFEVLEPGVFSGFVSSFSTDAELKDALIMRADENSKFFIPGNNPPGDNISLSEFTEGLSNSTDRGLWGLLYTDDAVYDGATVYISRLSLY